MRSHTGSGARGAAAGTAVLNAALITPLLVLIMLGIVETALLMKDNIALSSLIHQGSDAASSLAPEGPVQASELATATAVAVAQAKSRLSRVALGELWVYRPDAAGFPLNSPANDHFGQCTTDCIAYMWDASEQTFHYAGGHWDDGGIGGCSELGVYVKASHSFLTGAFVHAVDISKHETFRLASGADCQGVTS